MLRTTAGLDAVAELGFIGVGVDKQQTIEGKVREGLRVVSESLPSDQHGSSKPK